MTEHDPGEPVDGTRADLTAAAIDLARTCYLDERHAYGCAETAFVVLKSAFDLDDPMAPGAAMALNGGVAWSGGICGALTGAALAMGMLAEVRIGDHARAKLVARELMAGALERFREVHGSVDCRALIGHDLWAPGGHHTFLDSGVWRTRCMGQIETVVEYLVTLADETAWVRAVERMEAGPEP